MTRSPLSTPGTLRVGTSGWQYRDWRGPFYPRSAPPNAWLSHYATAFSTVEVNNSFYRLPTRERFAAWAAATPHRFRFAVKASRFLTHLKRLVDPDEPVKRLLDAAGGLGPKLDVVLLQLPPSLRRDVPRLRAALAAFPRDVRVALEVRHPSWFDDDVFAALHDARAALCLTDRRNTVSPLVRTTDWCYVRLHEGRASPPPCYGRSALRGWAGRITHLYGDQPAGYVYFNNDAGACAVRNAVAFTRLADE